MSIKMITVEQIRAARALLNLKQSELAKAAGISLASLNNIERHVTHPRIDTLKKIQNSLEDSGIEFLPQDGIRRLEEEYRVDIFEGEEAIHKWFQDITSTLKKTGDRNIYLLGIDDEIFIRKYKKELDHYLEELQKNGWREHVLVCEGDNRFYASPKTTTYRWVSKDIFSRVPYAVYGNTYSIITWGPPERLVIIKNQNIADSMRNQFTHHWEQSTIPQT